MSAAYTQHLTKSFGGVTALDNVSLSMEAGRIYGLLGRNGAGKTTLMSLLTGQDYPTSGSVRAFGQPVAENARVVQKMCFVRENQKYPESATGQTVFRSAGWLYPNWDENLCQHLARQFEVPLSRPMKKMSRGQFSAVGVILGLASRAPITFFDEPYLGLDAYAREVFYRELAAEMGEHPRTVIISSHLVDEIANLIDHVFVLDQGVLVLDQDAEELRSSAFEVTGPAVLLKEFVGDAMVIRREDMGGTARVTIIKTLSPLDISRAQAQRLDIRAASLQDLLVGLAQINHDGSAVEAKVSA